MTDKNPSRKTAKIKKTAVMVYLDDETLAELDSRRDTPYGRLPRAVIVYKAINDMINSDKD